MNVVKVEIRTVGVIQGGCLKAKKITYLYDKSTLKTFLT